MGRRRTAREICRSLSGIGIPKDIVVFPKSNVASFADAPSLVIYPALREGREIYHA